MRAPQLHVSSMTPANSDAQGQLGISFGLLRTPSFEEHFTHMESKDSTADFPSIPNQSNDPTPFVFDQTGFNKSLGFVQEVRVGQAHFN